MTHRIAAAALVALATVAAAQPALARGGDVAAQRAELKAKFAEARAMNEREGNTSLFGRIFGLDREEMAEAAKTPQPKKK